MTVSVVQAWTPSGATLQELEAAPVSLIPYPHRVVWLGKTSWKASHAVKVHCEDETLLPELQRVFKRHLIKLESTTQADQAQLSIRISSQEKEKDESYEMRVSTQNIDIRGKDRAGAFYGIQTLRQLLREESGGVSADCCEIEDEPAFAWRGFMHDTGRNFQTIASLKKQIDYFAAYKLNIFHWHLTDHPAWRPQSNIFPQLNDPRFRQQGRDPEKTYSFAEIRELIAYARERHVRVIPELDMPGHSSYFPRTFGVEMGSSRGMEILEKLLDEFCSEIPMSDCPVIHIGADEIQIPEPISFIKRMTARLQKNGRKTMLWSPGLAPCDDKIILQIWKDQSNKEQVEKQRNPIIDSSGGYLNSYDPLTLPMRYYFWQPCEQARGDEFHLGGILCMWPDIRVDDKRNIFRHSPVWPTLLAFSESIWQGRSQAATKWMETCPPKNSAEWKFFAQFEKRMSDHRARFFADEPFPWIKQSSVQWQVRDVTNNRNHTWTTVTGTVAQIPSTNIPIGSVIELKTEFELEESRIVTFWIGFDFIARSHRESGGIPALGLWDANGGTIKINGNAVPAPVWKAPGKYRFEKPTWEQAPNEIPLTDEELYWCRKPVPVLLKKGRNQIMMTLRKSYKDQNLQAICAPVMQEGQHWIEDGRVKNVIYDETK